MEPRTSWIEKTGWIEGTTYTNPADDSIKFIGGGEVLTPEGPQVVAVFHNLHSTSKNDRVMIYTETEYQLFGGSSMLTPQ